ncbi:hypothetical protein JA1_001033 [Spathaspora sp. JA1]|nr:hypothetical protein JA1_001033 [Spathaspora sp. JA1]
MNISENDRMSLYDTDIYNACNGEYYKGRTINREYLKNSTTHKLISKPNGAKLVIDKDSPDVDQIYISKGTVIPPDEILDMMKPGNIKIPIKDKQDFKPELGLPDSELLKVIHYFVSRRLTKNNSKKKRYIQRMDETALLAMGILIESWVDKLVDEKTCKLFLDQPNEEEQDEVGEESEESEETSSSESSESSSSTSSSSEEEEEEEDE